MPLITFRNTCLHDSGDYRYISVMIRLEHFRGTQDFVKSASMELGWWLMFLNSDCSKHGSLGICLVSSEKNEMMVKATLIRTRQSLKKIMMPRHTWTQSCTTLCTLNSACALYLEALMRSYRLKRTLI